MPQSGKNKNFSRSGKSQGESLIFSKAVKCQGIIIFSLHIKRGEKYKKCESEGRSIDGLPTKLEQT